MSNASPLALAQTWDLVAADYAVDIAPFFTRYAEYALDLAGVLPGTAMRVVDVATGPGTLALLAAARGASVAALDFSDAMVQSLRANVGAAPGASVEVSHGDGQALPYPDAGFDAGFSMFGLMFFPDRARGLAELRRVLRPGAPMVLSSWAPFDRVPLLAAAFGALRDAVPDLPPPPPSLPLGDPAVCERELTEAGFLDVQVRERTERQSVPSAAYFWSRMTRNNAIVALLRTRMDAGEWARVDRHVHDRLVADFGDAPLEVAYTALMSSGVRP